MDKGPDKFFRKLKPFDRRQYPRLKSHPPIQCQCTYQVSGTKKQSAVYLVNVSLGGLLMSTDDKILPAKEVEFRLQIPSRPEAIVIRGAVIRTYRCGSESWYNCAVKFSNPQEDSIKLLLGFMDQLKKTSH